MHMSAPYYTIKTIVYDLDLNLQLQVLAASIWQWRSAMSCSAGMCHGHHHDPCALVLHATIINVVWVVPRQSARTW